MSKEAFFELGRASVAAQVPEGWEIDRADKPPFNRIAIRSPKGHKALVDSIGRFPKNVLYLLADALLSTTPEEKS